MLEMEAARISMVTVLFLQIPWYYIPQNQQYIQRPVKIQRSSQYYETHGRWSRVI